MLNKSNLSELITTDPEIMGGTPVFKGTRVPVKTFFEYLQKNYSLDEFLECFPSVSEKAAIELLEATEATALEQVS